MISLLFESSRGTSNSISEITTIVPSWRHIIIIIYRIGLMKDVLTLINERIKCIYIKFLNGVHNIARFSLNKQNNII